MAWRRCVGVRRWWTRRWPRCTATTFPRNSINRANSACSLWVAMAGENSFRIRTLTCCSSPKAAPSRPPSAWRSRPFYGNYGTCDFGSDTACTRWRSAAGSTGRTSSSTSHCLIAVTWRVILNSLTGCTTTFIRTWCREIIKTCFATWQRSHARGIGSMTTPFFILSRTSKMAPAASGTIMFAGGWLASRRSRSTKSGARRKNFGRQPGAPRSARRGNSSAPPAVFFTISVNATTIS